MGRQQEAGRHTGGRGTALVAAAALVTVVLTGSAPGTADARTPAGFFGVVNERPTDRDFSEMAAAGVGTWRVTLAWSAIESSPGHYSWQAYDGVIAEAVKHRIQPLVSIFGTPEWAGPGCSPNCAPSGASGRAAFAAFARAAVNRYGPGGEFWTGAGGPPACGCSEPLPIRTWQIWNEPNSPKYYGRAPNAAEYGQLVAAAAGQIRAADPGAEVVLGGMWGPPGASSVVPTGAYLRQLYGVPGIKAAFDSIALHPYSKKLPGVIDQLRRVRRLARRLGDRRAGIRVTEFGWASGGPAGHHLVRSQAGQARMLRRSFRAMVDRRRAWRIRGIIWFKWRDSPPEESDCVWCPLAGLRTVAGEEKPAGRAFERLARRRR